MAFLFVPGNEPYLIHYRMTGRLTEVLVDNDHVDWEDDNTNAERYLKKVYRYAKDQDKLADLVDKSMARLGGTGTKNQALLDDY